MEESRKRIVDRMDDVSSIKIIETSEEEQRKAQEAADKHIEEAMERVLKQASKEEDNSSEESD